MMNATHIKYINKQESATQQNSVKTTQKSISTAQSVTPSPQKVTKRKKKKNSQQPIKNSKKLTNAEYYDLCQIDYFPIDPYDI